MISIIILSDHESHRFHVQNKQNCPNPNLIIFKPGHIWTTYMTKFKMYLVSKYKICPYDKYSPYLTMHGAH